MRNSDWCILTHSGKEAWRSTTSFFSMKTKFGSFEGLNWATICWTKAALLDESYLLLSCYAGRKLLYRFAALPLYWSASLLSTALLVWSFANLLVYICSTKGQSASSFTKAGLQLVYGVDLWEVLYSFILLVCFVALLWFCSTLLHSSVGLLVYHSGMLCWSIALVCCR